jgi:hypothetical protein
VPEGSNAPQPAPAERAGQGYKGALGWRGVGFQKWVAASVGGWVGQ